MPANAAGSDADAEREGCGDRQRETGLVREPAKRITQVLQQVFRKPQAPGLPNLLFGALDATKGDEGPAPSFLPAHSPPQIGLGLHLEVHAELLSEVLLFTRAEEEGSKPFASL